MALLNVIQMACLVFSGLLLISHCATHPRIYTINIAATALGCAAPHQIYTINTAAIAVDCATPPLTYTAATVVGCDTPP